jgi:hypothetical protein
MSTSSAQPPAEYVCPISYEVMTDPVVLDDGHTYERSAIETWLAHHSESPMTRAAVSRNSLKPNYALRAAIERWKAEQAVGDLKTGSAAAAATIATLDAGSFVARATATGGLILQCAADAPPLKTAVIAIIDQSGSMGEMATKPSTGLAGSREVNGFFTRLDLVKHSLKTIIRMLGSAAAGGSLGIVGFSDAARMVLPIQQVDDKNQSGVEKAVDAMSPGGGTNIWDGLRVALDMALRYGKANPDTAIHLVLLTDGEPTAHYSPLGGIVAALRRKMAASEIRTNIHCFGFGYNLDVKLLESICVEGTGTYGYIPDCSMIGTVFINFASSVLTTVATHVSVDGVHIGSILAGQTRVIGTGQWIAGEAAKVALVPTLKGSPGTELDVPVEGICTQEEGIQVQVLERLRAAVGVDADGGMSGLANAHAEFKQLAEWLEGFGTPFARAALQDVESDDPNQGQLLKAVETGERYRRWGQNHVAAYGRALALQQCTNFKDAVLQLFATAPFKAAQEMGNDLFDNMPPPVMSFSSSNGWSAHDLVFSSGAAAGSQLPLSMNIFNSAAGPCWTGATEIRLEDGRYKPASEVVAGDILWGAAKVVAVVKTVVDAVVPMVHLSPTAVITPWHPVRRRRDEGGDWQFPADIGAEKVEYVDFYYNLLLDKVHVVQLTGGWETCSLGHGFEDNDVIRHPYFGTGAVIEDLKKRAGWNEGLVVLPRGVMPRDPVTGLVCGLAAAAGPELAMQEAHASLGQMESGKKPLVPAEKELGFILFALLQQPRRAAYMTPYFRGVAHHMRTAGEAHMPALFAFWLDHMVRTYKVDDCDTIVEHDTLTAILNVISDVMYIPGAAAAFLGDTEFVPRLERALHARRFPQQNKLLVEEIGREIRLQGAVGR